MAMKGFTLCIPALLIACALPAHGQVDPKTQMYRDDAKGNLQYQRKGTMDGNRVRTLYWNTGEVAQWKNPPAGEWPKGTGHNYIDGVTVLIGAKIYLPGGRVITPIEAHYREETDNDPLDNRIQWGLEPVPGYSNPSSTNPAINVDPKSWPVHWPVALRADGRTTPDWDGYWYGYFGRGVMNSDFETFFVVDDSKDAEFTRPPFLYYPIAADSSRGGLGLRVEVRGFQWSHVLAEDVIFWHFDIVNISDRQYDSCAFGFLSDPGVGAAGDGSEPSNSAYYSTSLDLCYAWAPSGLGYPNNWKTGYYGYAYLESPGNAIDGLDNDEDGIVDERRDNGIDDDNDWTPFTDLNGSGAWDVGEPLNDDLGADGVGPFDPQYNGPDAGEGDGLPTHGEPNFDETDKDESDQIGLTAVALNALGDKGPTGVWPKNDDVVWRRMNNGFVDTLLQNANITIVFSSGPFPLIKDRRERFSMALLFGNDLNALIFNKVTVQNIYNANYNFSKPPYTPRLTAVAGDRKVFLFWDDRAEKSRDPFLGNKFDFEGYMVYRSTDAEFNDIKLITDSQGNPRYWKPLAQFDLKDSIVGPDPVGINGARFWRGDDTGLQHAFVDTTVVNGMRYYYALVAYDQGDPNKGVTGLQPAETPKIITEDFAGTLKFIDINCAIVTPNAAAAGYVPPQIEGNTTKVTQGIGTGRLNMQVLDPTAVREAASYRVLFNAAGSIPRYSTRSYSIIRLPADTIQVNVSAADFGPAKLSPPFDGLAFTFTNDTTVAVDVTATGWLGTAPGVVITVAPDHLNAARDVAWPADYELVWYGTIVDTSFSVSPATRFPRVPVNFHVTNTTSGSPVKFIIDDADRSATLTFGDTIRIVDGYVSPSNFWLTYQLSWLRGPGLNPQPPQDGDRYVLRTMRPFAQGDYFEFTTRGARMDAGMAKNDLNRIAVVPNPYIGSAAWERRSLFTTGRGDRRIDFIHLPAECTVRIYTVAGYLVKTLTKSSTDGALSWDLVTDDGMDIAYGLYVYHVDAPGVGEHVGKFAVIK
ncbi:MAG: hypothetical protein AB1428_02685 [Bacteroidota bacterium]